MSILNNIRNNSGGFKGWKMDSCHMGCCLLIVCRIYYFLSFNPNVTQLVSYTVYCDFSTDNVFSFIYICSLLYR